MSKDERVETIKVSLEETLLLLDLSVCWLKQHGKESDQLNACIDILRTGSKKNKSILSKM